MSYEWTAGKERRVDEAERPARLAATLAGVFVVREQLLLVNPHPDSWNNWQLPYHSVSMNLDETESPRSYSEIEKVLQGSADLRDPATLAQTEKTISEVLSTPIQLELHALLETYALRYSKTANVWTAYQFSYLSGTLENRDAVALRHTWLDATDDELERAGQAGEVDGLPLSDNLAAIFGDERQRTRLISAGA